MPTLTHRRLRPNAANTRSVSLGRLRSSHRPAIAAATATTVATAGAATLPPATRGSRRRSRSLKAPRRSVRQAASRCDAANR